MAFEQNDNSGSLFPNDKGDNPKRPDFKGSAMVDGVEMWISAWKKESGTGKKFLSLSFQPKEEQSASSAQVPATAGVDVDDIF